MTGWHRSGFLGVLSHRLWTKSKKKSELSHFSTRFLFSFPQHTAEHNTNPVRTCTSLIGHRWNVFPYTALRLARISMPTKLPEVYEERREIQQATHRDGSWFRPKMQVRSTLDHVLISGLSTLHLPQKTAPKAGKTNSSAIQAKWNEAGAETCLLLLTREESERSLPPHAEPGRSELNIICPLITRHQTDWRWHISSGLMTLLRLLFFRACSAKGPRMMSKG